MAETESFIDAVGGAGIEEQFEAIPLSVPQKSQTSMTPLVLVLEDDALQLELLIDHLHSLGIVAVSVMTIAGAREQLNQHKFDLAILDIQLPDGSGLELCESMADDARYCSLPTIVLSSMSQNNMVRRSRAAGARFFISKPYDPNVLLTVIERALGITLQ